jgi:hypothetical protein
MAGGWDDDDWVGTPPEGRHTRDRARPDFWARQRPPALVAAAIALLIVIAVIVALLG